MDKKELTFPCIYNESKCVNISDCSNCSKSNDCDIYASMLDESYEYNE